MSIRAVDLEARADLWYTTLEKECGVIDDTVNA